MARQDNLYGLRPPQPESPGPITTQELLNSRSITLTIGSGLLDEREDGKKVNTTQNIRIINHGASQNEIIEHASLLNIIWYKPEAELTLIGRGGPVIAYTLPYRKYPDGLCIYLANPEYKPISSDKPKIFHFPETEKSYIQLTSVMHQPPDLVMVIDQDQHSAVRPLTDEETELIVQRDEEIEKQQIPQAEASGGVTEEELLRSQPVDLQIEQWWLAPMGNPEFHPSKRAHVINRTSDRAVDFESVEILGGPHMGKHTELRIAGKDGNTLVYKLNIAYSSSLPGNLVLYPYYPEFHRGQNSVIQFPGEETHYVIVGSTQDYPPDILVVIKGRDCMVRSLSDKEAGLISKRDEEVERQAVVSKSPSPGYHKRWSYRREKMRQLQIQRNKLQAGNKGLDHGRKQSLMAAIDSEMSDLSGMSDKQFSSRLPKTGYKD